MPETNLHKFKKLLAELFLFDQADLDFGIYRIMNVKREEITRFLENDLLPQVREALGELEQADHAVIEAELAKAIEQAKALGADPESLPKVKELRQQLAQTADIEALESEVFSDLYNFFRRYYNEGDFISLRRYKEDVYAIPYEGEEVKLHWANADQYYIKSAEYFRDYTFRLPDGRRVHFKIAEADSEQHNNKPSNGQERRFILREQEFIIVEPAELVIRMEYRPDPVNHKQADLNADAARRILNAEQARHWLAQLATKAPTQKNLNRTLLDKHLADYTARNTFDYFIHKDLGGFLRRELDVYIKNEVMHLDDIESESAPRVEKYLARVRAIRRIAHKIIDFLAQFENFQKKLWLKKKFVVETNYCVTLDRISEELYPEIAVNAAQREEWVLLLGIDRIEKDLARPGYSVPLTVEFLKAHPTMVVDTRHFSPHFAARLLAAIPDLDEMTDGVLIHGENFQALNLVRDLYYDRIKCIYIDPPYNTDAGPILYKNEYRSSSWISLMENRLTVATELLSDAGVICVTVDDYQVHELAMLLDHVFGRENQLGTAVIRNNPSGRSTVKGFSVCHEYAFFYRRTEGATLSRLPRSEHQLERFTVENGIHVDWRNFRKDGGAVTHRSERPKQYYPIYVRMTDERLRIPPLTWDRDRRAWDALQEPQPGEEVIWPIDENGKERVWSLNHTSAAKHLGDLQVKISSGSKIQILRRHIPSEGVLPRSWWDKNTYAAREHGSAALTALFGGTSVFSFAKSPFAVQDCIWISGLDTESDECVMDFFAGSGTTGHAVVNLNREDGGRRKFILAEVEEYFNAVLLPRIKKVIFTPEWKEGKPERMATEEEAERSPRVMKVLRLESYEDALSNLELKRTREQGELLERQALLREDYVLHYMLDVESQDSASLLDLERFEDPFNYKLNIGTGTAGETRPVNVDLVETFNWLLGLRVKHLDTIRGFRVVQGRNPAGEKVLVIWRDTREKSNVQLDEFFLKQGYNTRDMEFDLIYVNGDNNLENLKRTDETWKVRLIEEEFKRLMFDVEDV